MKKMNKLIVDLHKIFSNNSKFKTAYAYELLHNFDSTDWIKHVNIPEKRYVKTSLLHKNSDMYYDLCLISWAPGAVYKEKSKKLSIYKVLKGDIYHFENSYEGTVGVTGNVKFVDPLKFDSFQTKDLSYTLNLYMK